MTKSAIKTYLRVDPEALVETNADAGESVIAGPAALVSQLKPGTGVVVAEWDEARQLGCASRYGVVVAAGEGEAKLRWASTDATFRPNPSGRRWWRQAKPFFKFAPDVVDRYMLSAEFAERFGEGMPVVEIPRKVVHPTAVGDARPSMSPTGGYVYLIRSPYGIKIGKSVNVRSRLRLFAVKLPFPISVEHYAWFDDYSHAERQLHLQYHAKRQEGEWFDLSEEDVAHIKSLGRAVPVEGL